jgi:transposase-like protein
MREGAMAAVSKGPVRSRQREEFWRRIVMGQPASGRSIRVWCQRHQVTEASFYAWRRTLAQRGILRRPTAKQPRAQLVAVEVARGPNTSLGSTPLGLVVGDLRIEIVSGFDDDTLRRLINVLRETAAC